MAAATKTKPYYTIVFSMDQFILLRLDMIHCIKLTSPRCQSSLRYKGGGRRETKGYK